jgi:hypothetical protein
LADKRASANAEVLATRQSKGAYLASSVNAQNDSKALAVLAYLQVAISHDSSAVLRHPATQPSQ